MPATRIDDRALFPDADVGHAIGLPEFFGDVIGAINDHANSIDGHVAGSFIDVKADFGATGDGVTDDSTAIRNALAAAAAAVAAGVGNVIVWFPAGTYIVSRSGVSAWCLKPTSGSIKVMGVPGASWVKAKAGMPNASVAVWDFDGLSRVTVDGLGIDGGWGNASTSVALASTHVALPTGTIHVLDTTDFLTSGTFTLVGKAGSQVITYTGKTSGADPTFTGCTGGTGTMVVGDRIVYVDDNVGINHTTQVDPKNYGIQCRGSSIVRIDNCQFRNIYGDAVWLGHSSANGNLGSFDVEVTRCHIRLVARCGISFPGKASRIRIDQCTFEDVHSGPFDTEPGQLFCGIDDLQISNSFLGGWINPGRFASGVIYASVVSANTVAPSQGSVARAYRFHNCRIEGPLLIQGGDDVVVDGCRIRLDYTPDGANTCTTAPIAIVNTSGTVKIVNNKVYDRTPGGATGNHPAAITVRFSGNGTHGKNQPTDVTIERNTVLSRNGTHGIGVYGVGGDAIDNGTYQPQATGTATSVTGTSMGDTPAAWAVNQWMGHMVRIGTAQAAIVSNTANALTLDVGAAELGSLGWMSPQGEPAPTPAAGTYVIFKPTGFVSIVNNHVDCGNDGYGAGGKGIYVSNSIGGSGAAGGMKVDVSRNKLVNCNQDGIYIDFVGANTWRILSLLDNTGWDDQATPTMTALLRFNGTPGYQVMTMRNNVPDPTVTTAVAGLTTGAWRIGGGLVDHWAGFGTPESVVTAPVGSIYQRLNGGAGTCFYVKESGTGNTGWVAK